MGLDQYAKLKTQKINFDKIFSDDSNLKKTASIGESMQDFKSL